MANLIQYLNDMVQSGIRQYKTFEIGTVTAEGESKSVDVSVSGSTSDLKQRSTILGTTSKVGESVLLVRVGGDPTNSEVLCRSPYGEGTARSATHNVGG